jgi:hypothetical protein
LGNKEEKLYLYTAKITRVSYILSKMEEFLEEELIKIAKSIK